jgi:hypothetical protein
VKKNLFNFDLSNSSDARGSLGGQITCEPCSSECEKIKSKINNRKLSDIKDEDVLISFLPLNIDIFFFLMIVLKVFLLGSLPFPK